MSNPWAQSFDELRSPYLQEKKAKRWQDDDCDGKWYEKSDVDGKISKREKKEKAKAYAEHHQKDADGKVIEHEDTTPSSVEEAKIDKIDPKNKRNRRNVAKFGKQTKPYDPPTKEMKTSMGKFMQKTRQDLHKSKRGVKSESYTVTNADKVGNTPAYQGLVKGKLNVKTGKPLYKAAGHLKLDKAHYDWKEELHWEALKRDKLDIKETGVKNKIEINPTVKTEAAKAPVKK